MKYWMVLAAVGAAVALGAVGAQAQPTPAQPAPPPVKAMTLLGASMPCTDFARSTAYYTKGMGMTARPGAGPNELVMQFPGGGATLLCQKPRDTTAPLPIRSGLTRLTIEVPSVKAQVDKLAAAGYPIQGGITVQAQYGVAVANATDPDGNQLELVQRGGVMP